ncbi:hypothetical protein [Cryobacterium sp. GrIS_2_6]|uniref:hypothetical protein n=1 Tax=Cryobacterium sp. GrIS_2_6 TaxID=3162785 RepID=UPI002DF96210|nr:hypothetical protein [Cryobacterium psychrotolerans]MEC5149266.1 hypothetical protein [Cryobacterium psychrotolerans]MEC5149344.1 hypothetical protein [Cryobacterium psychrotolerans]
MTLDECKQVVAKVQLGDNRQVDRLVIMEWFDTIGHLNAADAIAAVKMHRQESTDYLQMAHVIRNAVRVRAKRAIDSGPVYCRTHDFYPLPCDRCKEHPEEVSF